MRPISIIKKIPFILLGIFSFISLSAQQRTCGTAVHMEKLLKDPKFKKNYLKRIQRFDVLSRTKLENRAACANPVVLPIAVHFQNVPNPDLNCLRQLAQGQIDVLNADFHALNPDFSKWTNEASSTFPGVQHGDVCIEFCLASQNHPSGFNLNNGDLAVTVNQTNGDYDGSWSGYINIFVKFNTGVLGYSPVGGSGNGDGIVIDAMAFGTGAGCGSVAPNPAYALGRTLTHEMGHYLLLDHIWGGGCGFDDGVADTPDAAGSNFGCPSLGKSSCGSADLHMNYMDYSNDECMYMFSAGQATRMENFMNSNLNNLINHASSVCGVNNPPIASCNDGIQNGTETGVDCGGTNCNPCISENTCSDGIQNGTETGVDCGGTDCPTCETEVVCIADFVFVKIMLDNYGSETTWTLKDDNGTVVASGGPYSNNTNGQIVNEKICVNTSCYDFKINDAYGDGLCCAYGSGAYKIVDQNNLTLISGAAFDFSESQTFCIGGNVSTCDDGIQNGSETGIDCGGNICTACPTCNDGIQNGDEEGLDCGGANCSPCPTCKDGVMNANETGIDCGGPDCVPCDVANCSNLSLKITLDNYASETTWYIADANGVIKASAGPYQNGINGYVVNQNICLQEDCYDLVIKDSYGDGLCCAYGNGSYELTDANGIVLASGGEFASEESTDFCINNSTANTTCNDGVQNGNETGVDCGGNNCSPCEAVNGECNNVVIDEEGFEAGLGIWNDRGSDCSLIQNADFANTGHGSVWLRDDSNSSVLTSDVLDLSDYEALTISFSYLAISMDHANEDFWLQISTQGRNHFVIVEEWNQGDEFENNQRYSTTVQLQGPFTDNTMIRFRCDASSNLDWVFIDDITIYGCISNNNITEKEIEVSAIKNENVIKDLLLYPNPTKDILNADFELRVASEVQMLMTDFSGRQVLQKELGNISGTQNLQIDVNELAAGFYFVHLITKERRISKKFVIAK